MKKTTLILMFPLLCTISFGQNKVEAEKLVSEGVAYHDKGDYDGAIARYDKALALDKDNLLALTEKAYSLFYLQKYNESVTLCQKALEVHAGEKDLKTVYVTYGNALDALNKTDKSIEIYDEGIKQFPDYYMLHFNKGVSLTSVKKYDEGILCFEKAVMLNPNHAGSHNAIARVSNISHKRIPSLLAFCRFLAIDPESDRAKENLSSLQKIMKGNVEQKEDHSITISITHDVLGDTTANGKPKENDFGAADVMLSMSAALDFDKKNKDKTEVEQFTRKLETLCAFLKERKKDNYGFFWDYYVPYFIEMKDKNLVETYSYIAFASSSDPAIEKWLKSHKAETDKFFEWSDSFAWKTN